MRTRFASAPAFIPLLSFSLGTFIHLRDIFRHHTKLIAVALLKSYRSLVDGVEQPNRAPVPVRKRRKPAFGPIIVRGSLTDYAMARARRRGS